MSNNDSRESQAAGVTGAYIFFAALYFVQSVGDPTSGLIAQPVRSLLRSWGESPAALGALMALLAVPWTIKPIFGLLSDFVPLFGSRRRNYLLLANGLSVVSLGGYVAQERLQSLAFALCGVLWLFAFTVAWRYAGE